MENKKYYTLGFLAVLSCFLFSSLVYGVPEKTGEMKMDRENFWESGLENIVNELWLSPEQKTTLLDDQKKAQLERKNIHTAIRTKQQELKEELEKQESDQNAITAIANELKKLQGSMIDQRISSILKVKELLTPEQFQKFETLTQQKMREFMDKRGR
jgi:Spy/CpxP family protein refolding chaperone